MSSYSSGFRFEGSLGKVPSSEPPLLPVASGGSIWWRWQSEAAGVLVLQLPVTPGAWELLFKFPTMPWSGTTRGALWETKQNKPEIKAQSKDHILLQALFFIPPHNEYLHAPHYCECLMTVLSNQTCI